MKRFSCDVCSGEVFFDSSRCVRCGSEVGYVLAKDSIAVIDGGAMNWSRCANEGIAGCTWLVAAPGGYCASCEMTRTRPADADLSGLALFPIAEQSKRHLLRDLTRLGFPSPALSTDEPGLVFDLLSSAKTNVTIGHADGVITIDLAEGDDSYREKVRRRLAEPYRTMLGHFRHESGHYVEWRLLEQTGRIVEGRALFGDERVDYQAAIERHYDHGSPAGWRSSYISQYATMHPYEDFAETWAHYLHIQDTLETAVAFGLCPSPVATTFQALIRESWLPFATAMNVINRSLGAHDLYPFTLADPVIAKLDFVDTVLQESRATGDLA